MAFRSCVLLGSFLLGCLLLTACSSSNAMDAEVGAIDATVDAARVDAPLFRDSGHVCEMSCATGERCCFEDNAEMCFDIENDPTHCGGCAGNCVEFNRGNTCVRGRCRCGPGEVGCAGSVESSCCVSPDGSAAFCANLVRDPTNCGSCFRACQPGVANACQNGQCQCGATGGPCEGTPTSTCCDAFVDGYQCVDTTRDRANCGACGRRCTGGACVNGQCVFRDVGIIDAGAARDAQANDAPSSDGSASDAANTDAAPAASGDV